MARLDLENYVKVNERIAQFRQEFPEGAIHTNREPDLADGEGGFMVRFKAMVFRNKEEIELYAKAQIASATGHSELLLNDDKVTEKCETIAIGRALAILGYEVMHSVASQEEAASYNESRGRKQVEVEEAPRRTLKSKVVQEVDVDDEPELEKKPLRKNPGFSRAARQ